MKFLLTSTGITNKSLATSLKRLNGKPLKPETLYLLFDEYHDSVDDFLSTL